MECPLTWAKLVRSPRMEIKHTNDEFYLQNESLTSRNIIYPLYDEKEMWQSVVTVVGAVLASSNKSCHLWHHLFQPNSIDFIPGATVPGKLCKDEGVFYENLTDMNENGFFLSQRSYDHVTRGAMSLPCLYFTQFVNFACLCVHFLAFSKNAEYASFYKSIWLARDECWRGLTRSWKLLITRLNITTEERLSLIESCVGRIIKIGEFKEIEESLDSYENFLDTKIFRPSWKAMIRERESSRDKVVREHRDSVQSKIIILERNCPVFADKESFLTFLLYSTSFNKLKRFILMRPLLDAISRNLHMFIDFYLWLHHKMSMRYSRIDVTNISLSESLKELVENGEGDSSMQKRLNEEQMIYDFTKRYKESLRLEEDIQRDTKLCHIVGISQPRSHGLLYHYIEKMIVVYNGFLKEVESNSGEIDPKTLDPIASNQLQSVEEIDDMMELIDEGCCVLPSCTNTSAVDDPTLLESVTSQVYDLKRIQTAVCAKYIAKMKYLKIPSPVFWTFKDEKKSVTNLFIEQHSVNLENITKGIPASYSEDPDEIFTNQLEIRCHAMSYFSLLQTTKGLRIAISYFAKALEDENLAALHRNCQLEVLTLPAFLRTYTDKKNMENSVIIQEELYIDMQKLELSQSTYLQKLEMRNTVKALFIFVKWLNNGMYEYSSFPYYVKSNIKDMSSWTEYMHKAHDSGNLDAIYDKIKEFRLQLSKCNSNIRKLGNENNVISLQLKDYIPESLQEDEIFHHCFPDIPVSNYVKLSILLRQAEIQILEALPKNSDELSESIASWTGTLPEQSIHTVLNISVDQMSTSKKSKKELKDLTTDDVISFMKSLQLDEEYIESAAEYEINGEEILGTSDKILIGCMGMKKDPLAFFQFKVFITREYGDMPPSQLAKPCPLKKVLEFCRRYPELQDSVQTFKRYQIDGEMLLELSKDDAKLNKLTSFPQKVKKIIQSDFIPFANDTS